MAGSNIGNLELRFFPPSNISGRLEFEDEKVKEAIQKLLPGQLIQLNATGDQPMNGPNPGVVSANGALGDGLITPSPPYGYHFAGEIAGRGSPFSTMRAISFALNSAAISFVSFRPARFTISFGSLRRSYKCRSV